MHLNGLLDPEEPFVLSDPQGQFSFTNLAAGAFVVAEVLPAFWRQTFPTAGFGQRIMPTFGSAQLIQASGVNLSVSSYSAPAVADWNNDGKLDLIIGEEDGSLGKVRVYLNQGTPNNPAFGAYFYAQSMGVPLTVPAMGCLGAFPRVVDWDQDGRKDLLVGLANGTVQIFMNTNTDADPQFGAGAAVKFGPLGEKADIAVGARATLELVDWNNDGAGDLVVGALDGKVRVFLNEARTGTPDLRSMVTVKDGTADLTVPTSRASVAVTDLNGDGRKDLILGNTAGELYLYPNVGTDADPRFSGSQRAADHWPGRHHGNGAQHGQWRAFQTLVRSRDLAWPGRSRLSQAGRQRRKQRRNDYLWCTGDPGDHPGGPSFCRGCFSRHERISNTLA